MAVSERHGNYVVDSDGDSIDGMVKIIAIDAKGGGVSIDDNAEDQSALTVVEMGSEGFRSFGEAITLRNPSFAFETDTSKVYVYGCG